MKTLLIALALISSTRVFAANNSLDLVRNNAEVKSAIHAFEKNRSQKCSDIVESNSVISKNGSVKTVIVCNEYDQNGVPQANVYNITIRGNLDETSFDLRSVSIVGVE